MYSPTPLQTDALETCTANPDGGRSITTASGCGSSAQRRAVWTGIRRVAGAAVSPAVSLLEDDGRPETPDASTVSLIDYGCGYGALVDHLRTTDGQAARRGRAACAIVGFDVSAPMIDAARARHADKPWCTFTAEAATLRPADFVVASGIFNVKLDHPIEAWRAYVLRDTATRCTR